MTSERSLSLLDTAAPWDRPLTVGERCPLLYECDEDASRDGGNTSVLAVREGS